MFSAFQAMKNPPETQGSSYGGFAFSLNGCGGRI